MKAIALILGVVVLGTGCVDPESRKITAPQSDSIVNWSEAGSFKVFYPRMQNYWADSILKGYLLELEELNREISPRLEEEHFQSEVFTQYQLSQSGTVTSILFNTYIYSGGAHGNRILKAFNLDLVSQRQIELHHLFDTNPVEVLRPLVIAQIKHKLGDTLWIAEGIRTLDDLKYFTLDVDTLTVYFPPYQVASYADGVQEAKFNIKELPTFRDKRTEKGREY